MPAIRDQSFSYATVTAGGTMTIPTPVWEANDLIFVFVTGDTGTPTITLSTGVGSWTQLFQRVNTCSLTVFWKYAASGEAGDITATISVAESYSCCAVSVRDVYQSYSGGSPPVYSQTTSTGTRVALPTITTSANDSIVLAAISGSAAAPSCHFVESVLHDLVKCDGTAEGMGVGWFYQRTAGTTTAYNAGVMTSGAGGKCVIECRAPSGGATVIPPYVSSESSIYLTPSPGIAFDSNTALAATADTNFGTSIASKTCNDGTVAVAVADIGIDSGSFQSFGGITNTAVANQMSGAETVMASTRYDVGNRNIMTFFRHATPVQNQRLSTVASGRGVWMGMKSGTTAAANWAVWQVHGGDAPLINGYVQPIIINAANTDTIATNSTITNSDVRRYGFWTGGIGALTQQASFGPMWAMDTTVVSGGDSTEPIGIPEIYKTAALAKVRLSSLQQGANQLLCLQAIQFGDGGTNPLYVKVNGAAVEFPSQKNLTKKLLNYNGIDNAVGWSFYPGASDTINLSGTAFASASKYHWKIHASASASATYNFTGVVLNGAGDVQLRAVTTFTGMTYSNCLTITQNSAVINDCVFTASKITSATLGDMDNISNCAFTSSGTGYAIEVGGTASTITFSGNTFTGYAASNGTTGNEAIYVNIASGTVTINITGGGSTPSIRTAGATVVVQNAVTVTVTVKDAVTLANIENARVLLEKVSDGTDILPPSSLTNSSGVVTASYAYSGDTAVTGTARRASAAYGTLYKPGAISGTITSAGLDVTILLNSDE